MGSELKIRNELLKNVNEIPTARDEAAQDSRLPTYKLCVKELIP
jgi:hypothetical protein